MAKKVNKGNKLKYHNNGLPKPAWKPKAYTPEELSICIQKYLKNNETNFMYRTEIIKSGEKAGQIVKVPVRRPITISGFCEYASIAVDTFFDYAKLPDYIHYCQNLSIIARNNQFDGAALNIYNANIMAYSLGLRNQMDLNITSGGSEKMSIVVDGDKVSLSKEDFMKAGAIDESNDNRNDFLEDADFEELNIDK